MGGARRAFSPLDEELGLTRHAYTPRLVGQIVYVGQAVPFGEASRLLGELVGVAIPGDTVRRITEEAGQALVALETGAVERTAGLAERLQRPVRVVDPVQQVSVDGAMVPLVGVAGAELKTVASGGMASGGSPPTTRC